jgi:hypothetical protein
MNYEELHKNTINRLQQLVSCGKITVELARKICTDFIPESDDEKIRKEIISAVNIYCSEYHRGTKVRNDMLAWLEKQCEQKPFDYENANIQQKDFASIEPKFHEGEWVVSNRYTSKPFCITKICDTYYLVDSDSFIPFEQESDWRLWTIQDAKDGDVLFQDLMGGKTFIYNGVNPDMAILYSFIISNDGEDVLSYHIGKPNTGIGNIEENKDIIHPVTKEQRDLLFQKMQEAGYEWDANKRELKKMEQKNSTDRFFPSDEQMLAINTAINVLGKGTINGKYLIELHEQLKKQKQ